MAIPLLFHFVLIFCCLPSFCFSANRIIQGQSISDGQTVISEGRVFELGFFSPDNSANRYLGIWYYGFPTRTVVWVANREKPISGKFGVLKIGDDGNVWLLDGNNSLVWSTKASFISSRNTTAILKDDGNFVLLSSKSNKDLWQSFGEPTDTYLPGMKVYLHSNVVENRVFTSWRSPNDPSPGNFSLGLDYRGAPQIVIWNGKTPFWRSGHWNKVMFIGVPDVRANYLYGFNLNVDNPKMMYFTYTLNSKSDLLRFQLRWNGTEEQARWDRDGQRWSLIQSQPANECYKYNRCGPFGKCDITRKTICSCLEGFEPKNTDEWVRGNWSGGCIRSKKLQCGRNETLIQEGSEGDKFLDVDGVKLPDLLDYVGAEDFEHCRKKCLSNCSCIAFAFVDGINCMMWTQELIDIQAFEQGGNTLHVRVALSDGSAGGIKKGTKVAIIVSVVVGIFFLSVLVWLLWKFKSKGIAKASTKPQQGNNEVVLFDASRSREFSTDFSVPDDLSTEGQEGGGPEIPLLSFSTVAAATDEFSNINKLGQGGFGSVYKGKLPCGQEIAVKRLSRRSGQGIEEFRNELMLIAKLQHRNLVKLLGYCIQGDEKMLLYEYMPNKSLDFFLFDPFKKQQLHWTTRYSIVEGIARGLLYLHRDSRLRIIHRDLKASNILLDEEMNPKISDFGMARIFGGSENETNTIRVVGTYGYMAPEYAMEGLFSVKSDVYSFGILLLEIITGKRNTNYRSTGHSNIVGYAWSLWERGKAMELVDPSIVDSCNRDQVLRCIHVSMLCVQDLATNRPNMSSVVLMLESEGVNIPEPRQPTFTSRRSSVDLETWNSTHDVVSSGNITITGITGR